MKMMKVNVVIVQAALSLYGSELLLHNYENNALVTALLVLEAGQRVRAHAACIDRGTYMHCQL